MGGSCIRNTVVVMFPLARRSTSTHLMRCSSVTTTHASWLRDGSDWKCEASVRIAASDAIRGVTSFVGLTRFLHRLHRRRSRYGLLAHCCVRHNFWHFCVLIEHPRISAMFCASKLARTVSASAP